MNTTRLTLAIVIVVMAVAMAACGGGSGDDADEAEVNPFGLEVQSVAAAANPVALTFAPDGRLFFAEKYTGNIRVVDAAGNLLSEPFAHIDVANWLDLDWGLTGLALDPDFASNHHVYAFYTEVAVADNERPVGRPVLARFTDQNSRGTDMTVLIDDFPETRLDHQGFKTNGAIHFGPDGALYLTMGDFDWGKGGPNGIGAAQDLSFPVGKVLRIDTNALPLSDNPFADDPAADPRVFAYGFGHGRAFDFHPETGDLYTTDGTDSCEELDIVRAGADYGWPDVGEFPFSDCYAGAQERAIYLIAGEGKQPGGFQSGIGVTGLSFLSGTKYTALGEGLLVCGSTDSLMRRLVLTGQQVTANDVVIKGCDLDVAVSANGTIYYSSKTEIKRLEPGAGTPAAATPTP